MIFIPYIVFNLVNQKSGSVGPEKKQIKLECLKFSVSYEVRVNKYPAREWAMQAGRRSTVYLTHAVAAQRWVCYGCDGIMWAPLTVPVCCLFVLAMVCSVLCNL